MNDDGPRVLFTLFGADAESASNIRISLGILNPERPCKIEVVTYHPLRNDMVGRNDGILVYVISQSTSLNRECKRLTNTEIIKRLRQEIHRDVPNA